jgi:TonB family protein
MNEDITAKGSAINPFNPGAGLVPYSEFSKADWTNQFYGEYTKGRLRIDSEYRRYWRNQEIFNGTSESFADVRGWYVSGAYRICKRLQIGSYYSRYTITNVVTGALSAFYPPATNTSLPTDHDYDKVITGRVDLNRFWNVKVEGHFMNGYGSGPYPNGFYTQVNPKASSPNTNALVLRPASISSGEQGGAGERMKCPKLLLVAAGLAIFVSVDSLADNVKVIANSSVKADTISEAELKRVFLEERISLPDGTHVEPVLMKEGAVEKAFLQKYLGVTEDDLQIYYRTLLFTGRGSIPKVLESDAEVVAYVARTRGAIGYVSASASAVGVKTLAIGVAGNDIERKLITRVEPDYPDTLKQLNIGGTVRLRISISAKGNVENAVLLGGNPILGESAAIAVKQWIYAPSRSLTFAEISISFGDH